MVNLEWKLGLLLYIYVYILHVCRTLANTFQHSPSSYQSTLKRRATARIVYEIHQLYLYIKHTYTQANTYPYWSASTRRPRKTHLTSHAIGWTRTWTTALRGDKRIALSSRSKIYLRGIVASSSKSGSALCTGGVEGASLAYAFTYHRLAHSPRVLSDATQFGRMAHIHTNPCVCQRCNVQVD